MPPCGTNQLEPEQLIPCLHGVGLAGHTSTTASAALVLKRRPGCHSRIEQTFSHASQIQARSTVIIVHSALPCLRSHQAHLGTLLREPQLYSELEVFWGSSEYAVTHPSISEPQASQDCDGCRIPTLHPCLGHCRSSNVVIKFCEAESGQFQPTASGLHQSEVASSRL